MPNGHDRNLTRLMIALESFKAIHGHWPERVRLEQGYIDEFRTMLVDDGFRRLTAKVELVPDENPGMRAEDSQGASFTYGREPTPSARDSISTLEWLGELSYGHDWDD